MINDARILITGGCGFIGTNLTHHLLEEYECEIVNLDALTYAGVEANIVPFESEERYEFVEGDVCEREIVESVIDECDAVVHLAAESHVDRSIDTPNRTVRTNVLGTDVLLDCARECEVDRFLYMSTDEVYGSIEGGEFDETDCLKPSSPYAASKAGADHLVQSYHRTYDLDTVTVRCTNNFGPFQLPEKLIPLFVTNLLEDKQVPLYGTGENVRDWLFVKDACRALSLILDRGDAGERYNVGGNNHRTNTEVTQEILSLLDKTEEYIEYVEDRPGHDYRYAVDDAKVRQLGWEPTYTFRNGLTETVAWYQSHPEWWKRLK